MKKIISLAVSVVLVLTIAFISTGCKEGSVEEIKEEAIEESVQESIVEVKEIGISLLYRRDEYYKDLEATFLNKAKEYNFELKMQDADLDIAKQVQQIEDFMIQEVDAVAFAPVDAFGIVPTVEEAIGKGIPVFVFDSKIESDTPTSQIIFDLYNDGAIMGEWSLDYIKNNMDGKAKIAVLDFMAEPMGSMIRAKGFMETIEKANMPGIEIVAHQDGEASRTASMSVMEDILIANPDVNFVFGINFDTCAGAKAAIVAADMTAIIVGLGWGVESFEALENDDPMYKAWFVPAPPILAENTLKIIRDYFDGKELVKTFEGKSFILDASNINEYDWRSIIALRQE